MTDRQTIVETTKATLAWLQGYGDFEHVHDDDTDYIPAAHAVLEACLEALTADEPDQACTELIERTKNPPTNCDDEFFHSDLATCDFNAPLLDLFDLEAYYTRLESSITRVYKGGS